MRTQAAIRDFLQSCLARNLTRVTIAWYREKLQRFARSYPRLPEEPGPIEKYLAGIQGSPETRHAHFRVLRALFRFASNRHGVPNPIAKVTAPRCPKKVMATLEPDQIMRLLQSASTLRERAILTLLVDTGIRTGEAAGLRKQDVKENTIGVRGKCGERELPISDETRRLLLTLIANDGKDEYVFHGHKGRLSRHGIYRIVVAHMKKASIHGPKLGGHRIRHAFGKGYLVNGGDIRSLQQLMGHANITTTEKYASLNLNDVIAKHHKFTPLRSAHAAAQESFFDTSQALKEAEAIVAGVKDGD